VLNALATGSTFSGLGDPNRFFDFETGLGGALIDDYKNLAELNYIDAKASVAAAAPAELANKALNTIVRQLPPLFDENLSSEQESQIRSIVNKKRPQDSDWDDLANITGKSKTHLKGIGIRGLRSRFPMVGPIASQPLSTQNKAAGGNIFSRRGTDTVPAMLTPGEFVINKRSAQKVGYGNLNKINRYASGGVVGTQYLKGGGEAMGGAAAIGMVALPALMSGDVNSAFMSLIMVMGSMDGAMDGMRSGFGKITGSLSKTSKGYKQALGHVQRSGGGFVKLRTRTVQLSRSFNKAKKAVGKQGMMMMAAFAGTMASQVTDAIADGLRGSQITIGSQTGFENTTAGEAGLAAGVASAGQGAGTVLMAAQVNPYLAALAAGGVAIKSFTDAMSAARKQMAFIQWQAFSTQMEKSTKALEALNKEGVYNSQTLDKANQELDKTPDAMKNLVDNVVPAMVKSQGWDRIGNWAMAGGAGGAAIGAGVGATVGAAGAGVGAAPGAGIGAVIGGIVGAAGGAWAAVGANAVDFFKDIPAQQAKAFDLIAEGFTDKFMSELDQAAVGAGKQLATQVNKQVLDAMTNLDVVDLSAPGVTDKEVKDMDKSFRQLNTIMNSTSGETRAMMEQVRKLGARKALGTVVKDLAEMAKFELDDDKQEGLKAISAKITSQLKDPIDEAFKSGNFGKLRNEINSLSDGTQEQKDKVFELILAQAGLIVSNTQLTAVEQKLADAALAAQRGLDALAAGVEQFASRMDGIGSFTDRIATRAQESFAQITGTRTIGQVDRISAFANPANASDEQINASVARLRGLGPERESGVAFQGVEAAVRVQRDAPLAMKQTMDRLRFDKAVDEDISNIEIRDAIADGLGTTFDQLPKEMQKAITTRLDSLTAKREGGEVFTAAKIEKMLTTEGGMEEITKSAKLVTDNLAKADNALLKFQNSILNVAKLEQEMMQRRLETQMAIMDKESSIRDRVNKVTGKFPNLLNQAFGDLQKEMTTLAGGGVQGGTADLVGSNILDPTVLGNRITTLQGEADKKAKSLGIGSDESAEDVKKRLDAEENLTDKLLDEANELAELNQQINGSKEALKALANDTRVLAALEQQAAKAKEKEIAAQSGALTMIQGLQDLRAGKIDQKSFNERFIQPLQNVEDAFSGNVSAEGGLDVIQRMMSGDQLAGGLINRKISELTAQRQAEDPSVTEDQVRSEFLDQLVQNLGNAEIAALGGDREGIANFLRQMLGDVTSAQDAQKTIGQTMQEFGDLQIRALEQLHQTEEAAFRDLMQAATQDFHVVVSEFHKAVIEFSQFRETDMSPEEKSKRANIDHTPTWRLDELADKNKREQEAAQLAGMGSAERAARARHAEIDRKAQEMKDSIGIDTTGVSEPDPDVEHMKRMMSERRQKEIDEARAKDQASAGTARGNLANVGQPQPPAVARQAEAKKQMVLANTRTNRQRHRLQGSIKSDEERLRQLRDSNAPAGQIKRVEAGLQRKRSNLRGMGGALPEGATIGEGISKAGEELANQIGSAANQLGQAAAPLVSAVQAIPSEIALKASLGSVNVIVSTDKLAAAMGVIAGDLKQLVHTTIQEYIDPTTGETTNPETKGNSKIADAKSSAKPALPAMGGLPAMTRPEHM